MNNKEKTQEEFKGFIQHFDINLGETIDTDGYIYVIHLEQGSFFSIVHFSENYMNWKFYLNVSFDSSVSDDVAELLNGMPESVMSAKSDSNGRIYLEIKLGFDNEPVSFEELFAIQVEIITKIKFMNEFIKMIEEKAEEN